LPRAALAVPVVVLVPDLQPADAVALARLGVQDVLPADADVAEVGRSLRLAVERRAIEQAARRAFATDLATGLPSEAQLREHATQLLALREREPAPMALIVLRLDGLAAVADALGAESAQVLRRKAAVRLRAGLRASDVVASLGADAFAVLLAWIVSPADGARVAGKLARSLAQPLAVAGRSPRLGVSVGLASFPEQGSDFDSLLRRALAQAASVATGGATGLAGAADRGPDAAANDGD
ncbi:MAG: GGDEF domain-containing protein, partial [Rubrivivax sp.]|nr:GGDEF domain-containing protein [Rubrivivax sp.]